MQKLYPKVIFIALQGTNTTSIRSICLLFGLLSPVPTKAFECNFRAITELPRPKFGLRTLLGVVTAGAVSLGWYLSSGDEIGYSLSEEDEEFLLQSIRTWTFKDFEKATPTLARLIVEQVQAVESHWWARPPKARPTYLRPWNDQKHLGFAVRISGFLGPNKYLHYAGNASASRALYVARRVRATVAKKAEELDIPFPEIEGTHSLDWLRVFAKKGPLKALVKKSAHF